MEGGKKSFVEMFTHLKRGNETLLCLVGVEKSSSMDWAGPSDRGM